MSRVHLAVAVMTLMTSPSLWCQDAAAPAQGFSIWARAAGGSAQDLLGSAVGAPQISIGSRRRRSTFGLGIGFARFQSNDRDELGGGNYTEAHSAATLFQAGPELLYDFWRSPDEMTHGNIAAGLSLGRMRIVDEDVSKFGGLEQRTESKSSGSLVTLRLAVGGDHHLSRHFALGFETGARASFALGIKQEGTMNKTGFGAAGTYAALRAQVVLGQ